MQDWIKKEIYNFVDYIKNIKNFSEETEKTYNINLLNAIKYIDIYEENDFIVIDLMPYRLHIKDKAKKTIYKKISIFNSFIKYLQQNGTKIKLLNNENIKVSKTLPKPIKDEYIIQATKDASVEDKLLVNMIYALGLRISEIASLKLDDIYNDWVIIKGKGGKIRQLPLVLNVKNLLQKYKKANDLRQYLFEKDGKKLTVEQLRYRVTKVFKDIGLKVSPHQLRHSFATELLQNGAKISDVSSLLGHSSLESTQIYTKLTSSLKKENYNKAHPLLSKENEDV